jgi:hypothetical protein
MGFLGWIFLDGFSWTVSWMGFLGWVFLDGFSWMVFLGWMDCEMCVKKDLEECVVILQ